MQAHIEGFRGPIEVRQFAGGQSNPTFLVQSANHRYVLRRKPPGKLLPSAHAVDREYRVIAALANTAAAGGGGPGLWGGPGGSGAPSSVRGDLQGGLFWGVALAQAAGERRPA